MKAKCSQCHEMFSGLEDFDRHRPGKPGVKRPCLSVAQMIEAGWTHDSGKWHRPGFANRREQLAQTFRKTA